MTRLEIAEHVSIVGGGLIRRDKASMDELDLSILKQVFDLRTL